MQLFKHKVKILLTFFVLTTFFFFYFPLWVLLENEPVDSVESTFTVSRRPLSFCKVSS